MAPRDAQQHTKIADYLRDLIRTETLKPGDFLPSEAELCSTFASSRGPVRQAIAALRAEGLVSSGRGRRSVVLGRFRSESFNSIVSITHWLAEHGIDAKQKTLWLARRPAPEIVANSLNLDPEAPVVFVHRVRSTGESPIAIERMYFPLEAGRALLDFDTESGSIHDYLSAQGVEFDNVHRELSLIMASEEDAQALGIEPGTPLCRVCIEISDHSGRAVEWSENLFRVDRIKLGMTNVRGTTSPLEVIPTEGHSAE